MDDKRKKIIVNKGVVMSTKEINNMINMNNHIEEEVENKFLTFSLGDEEYGINIKDVNEIIGIQSITQIPDSINYIKGVINLRGKVYPLIDMRLRFGMEERDYDERTCIVVVTIDEHVVGLIVDTVSEVLEISDDCIDPPPSIINNSAKNFIDGLGKVDEQVKILLNSKKVLFDADLENLCTAVE
jgi:purine-binding chemotaxis protein CheW